MFNSRGEFGPSSVLRVSVFVALACSTAFCAEPAKESTSNLPKVTAVSQITHDGMSKANLVTDESDLFVTEWLASGRVVAKMSLRTAERAVVSVGFPDAQALDVSADHTRLLISHQGAAGENEFWAVPLKEGAPQRMGDLTGGRYATWSRDNKHLVFVKGSAIFLANADGSGAHEIYRATGSVFAPRFSPDGKRIRFSLGSSIQNTSIWEVGANGSHPHAVFEGWEHASAACCGSWTTNGAYYVFQVTQTGPSNLTTLWAVSDSGQSARTTPFQLTSGPMSFGNALPSHDNKRLWAFGVQPTGELVKYDAAKKTFSPVLSGVSATDLDYSPDGNWVVYVSVPDGALWRSKADGTEKLQLTSAPERAALPRWSPTGDRIAYVSLQPDKPSQIVLMSPAGGDAQAILPESRGQIDINWSSDGSRILFGYFLHDPQGLNIAVVDLKSHKTEIVPGSEQLFSPRWSPNGRYVAALTPDFTKVMLFDYKAQKWFMWLSEPAGSVNYPAWSADSKYLYFDDLVSDEESIRRVKVGENKAERVFKLEGIDRYLGPFGLWSGRLADGSYLFVRDRSTQEVYQLTLELP